MDEIFFINQNSNIKKIAIGQGGDYTTCCLLDYNYLNKYHKMIAINLSKQQELDTDAKAIQEVNFIGDLAREVDANTILFVVIR